MSKCKLCKIENIEKIEFCDLLCEKCSECNYLIFKGDQFDLFILNLTHYYNIGNIRKYYNLDDMTSFEKYAFDYFLKYMSKINEAIFKNKFLETNMQCSICNDQLYFTKVKNVKIYICKNCEAMYLNKNELINYINDEALAYDKFVKYMQNLKFKIKRFFHRRKNNGKK